MAFEQFPYTNLHDLNLDWILEQVKTWAGTADNFKRWQDDTNKAFKDLKRYVHDYFDKLDVADEIDNKLDRMLESGELGEVIAQTFANIREFTGSDRGFKVTRVKDTVLQYNKFTKTHEVESYLIDDTKIGYTAPTVRMNLDVPVENAVPTITMGSYLGSALGSYVSDKCTLNYKPFFIDTDLHSGDSITVANDILIVGRHAAPPVTPPTPVTAKRQQVIEVVDTYYQAQQHGREFTYGSNFVTYSNNTAVNDSMGRARMECDTLVALAMLGLKYGDTPYSNDAPDHVADFTSLPTNPHSYTWVLPWRSDNILGRKVTWTGGINWWLWYHNYVYRNKAELASGDIVIFTKPDGTFFDGITHIGIANIDNGVPYLYHVTGSSAVESPMQYEPLADVIARGHYDEDLNVYFARPNYT